MMLLKYKEISLKAFFDDGNVVGVEVFAVGLVDKADQQQGFPFVLK